MLGETLAFSAKFSDAESQRGSCHPTLCCVRSDDQRRAAPWRTCLLALGLNLIFGVIDVVWICYADIVMCGMYAVYFLYTQYSVPLPFAWIIAIVGVAGLGILVHLLIIALVPDSPPLNQLLPTGGLLFFLQSLATLLFGTDFRNIGVRLPVLEIATMYMSFARLIAFGAGLVGVVALYFFLKRTYIGIAIRAIAQDREIVGLMGPHLSRGLGHRCSACWPCGLPAGAAI